VLLALTAAGLFILPLIPVRSVWIDGFLTLQIMAALAVVMGVRVLRFVAAGVALAAVMSLWTPQFGSETAHLTWRLVSRLVLILIVCTAIAYRALAPGTVTMHRIGGAVLLYLLAGIAFSLAYQLIAVHDPGAFSGVIPAAGDTLVAIRSNADQFTYYSFMTLTTVGYGDISPVRQDARLLATFEALIGQLYPVVALARLVSLQIMHESGRRPD
jgi:voltage-gated potassium channel Kch